MWLAGSALITAQDGEPNGPGEHLVRGSLRSPAAVSIRPLGTGDRECLMLIFTRLGPQSRVQRFLAPRPVISERDLSGLVDVDGWQRAGVIAFAGSPAAPVGAAHYVRTEDPELAETAIEVVENWQRRGIGRLLIAELRRHALTAGIRRFEWFAFGSNPAVATLARDLGEHRRVHVGGGVVKCSAAIC
jgi:GNAT superfamily N-acetyltransferase